MLGTNVLIDAMAALLAADTGTLAEADKVKIILVKAPITPSPSLLIGDVTPADFVTSTPLLVGSATAITYKDPATGQNVIELSAPAGGWHWQTTAGTNLPQTIYGGVLTDNDGLVVLGCFSLPNPIDLIAVGQGFDLGVLKFTLDQLPLQ